MPKTAGTAVVRYTGSMSSLAEVEVTDADSSWPITVTVFDAGYFHQERLTVTISTMEARQLAKALKRAAKEVDDARYA